MAKPFPVQHMHTKKQVTPSLHRDSKKNRVQIYIGIGIVLFVIFYIVIYVSNRDAAQKEKGQSFFDRFSKMVPLVPTAVPTAIPTSTIIPSPTATPTPTPRAIPRGKRGFSVSMGKKTGPLFSDGYLDPYDPQKGSRQTISIRIVSNKPVAATTATLQLDNGKNISEPLKLVEGVAVDGRYEVTWTMPHTYLYTYNLVFAATDSAGEMNEVVITLR